MFQQSYKPVPRFLRTQRKQENVVANVAFKFDRLIETQEDSHDPKLAGFNGYSLKVYLHNNQAKIKNY